MTDIENFIAEAKKEEAKEPKIRPFNKVVSVDLQEYLELKQMEIDFARIMGAIVESFGLSWDKEELAIKREEKIVDVVKVLYPELCKTQFERLKEMSKKDEEDE